MQIRFLLSERERSLKEEGNVCVNITCALQRPNTRNVSLPWRYLRHYYEVCLCLPTDLSTLDCLYLLNQLVRLSENSSLHRN